MFDYVTEDWLTGAIAMPVGEAKYESNSYKTMPHQNIEPPKRKRGRPKKAVPAPLDQPGTGIVAEPTRCSFPADRPFPVSGTIIVSADEASGGTTPSVYAPHQKVSAAIIITDGPVGGEARGVVETVVASPHHDIDPPKRKRGRPRKAALPPSQQEAKIASTPVILVLSAGDQVSEAPAFDGEATLMLETNSRTPHQNITATVNTIVEEHRRRWDFIRARQRLELQAQAVCRRVSDGDKVAAAKLWSQVQADDGHSLRVWLTPFMVAMEPLREAQAAVEKTLTKLVRTLPIHVWAKEVKGLGDVSLSAIIGECAAPVGEYKSVAAVWKRMGLAVLYGERQRRRAGEAAIEQGYSPTRRAIMWNVGASLLKGQVRKDPDDPEKRIAIGEYGQLYLDRKVIEAERVTKAHAHNRAQRYIEKRLLRELYGMWRAMMPIA